MDGAEVSPAGFTTDDELENANLGRKRKNKTSPSRTKLHSSELRFVRVAMVKAEEMASRVCDERRKSAPLTPFLPQMGKPALDNRRRR
jgi:hypothetical protein